MYDKYVGHLVYICKLDRITIFSRARASIGKVDETNQLLFIGTINASCTLVGEQDEGFEHVGLGSDILAELVSDVRLGGTGGIGQEL